jgi:hypothetical protein
MDKKLIEDIADAAGLGQHWVDEFPPELRNASPEAQRIFRTAMANGGGYKFAIMVALQQPPGTRGTDRTLMEGKLGGGDLDKLPTRQAQRMVREARAAGINISGKTYMSGIANKSGHCDPRAWVSSVDEVKKVCKDRGLSIRGAVNFDSPEVAPPKSVPINPKLERQLIKDYQSKNPGMSRRDAKQIVWDKHVPHWKKTGK